MNILAIDGGGVRGVMTIAYLAALEEKMGAPLGKHFDAIAGTSVGAIVAAYLANGGSAADAIKLFSQDRVDKIFARNLVNDIVPLEAEWRPKYSGVGKTTVLQEVFGDAHLHDVKTKLLIPAYDYVNQTLAVWKSWTGSDGDDNPLLSEVVDASSAAPLYFPPIKMGNPSRYFMDGGIAANNPSACVLAEYMRDGGSLNDIAVLSVGSGIDVNSAAKKGAADKSLNWGILGWLTHGLVDDILASNIGVASYLSEQMLGQRYIRIDPKMPIDIKPDMDATKPDNLAKLRALGQAEFEATGERVVAMLRRPQSKLWPERAPDDSILSAAKLSSTNVIMPIEKTVMPVKPVSKLLSP